MAAETISEKLDRISRKGYPTTASVEVTARCNARCAYCYLQGYSFTELSTEQLCAAIDKLSKSGVFHLHITGGEPFLRPDILDILCFAFDHGIFQCTLFSNGILLSDEHRDFLVRHKELFRNIQMSVFSHIPEINDRFFGVPGAFDATMKNALFLRENGFKVALALSLQDFNIDKLEEMRRFFEARDLTLVLAYFKTITDSRIETLVASSTSCSFFKCYLENLRPEELGRLKKEMKESLEGPRRGSGELCPGRWNTVYMNAQGDLAPCVSFRNVTYGNIFEDRSVHDILLASADYHAICAVTKHKVDKCATCKFFDFCTICVGAMHSEKGSFYTTIAQVCNFAHALYAMLD